VLDEARDYLRAPIPERCANKLARRAEASWQNIISGDANIAGEMDASI
jgi:hypothetical protein